MQDEWGGGKIRNSSKAQNTHQRVVSSCDPPVEVVWWLAQGVGIHLLRTLAAVSAPSTNAVVVIIFLFR